MSEITNTDDELDKVLEVVIRYAHNVGPTRDDAEQALLAWREAYAKETEIALARKVLGVSSMVRKQKGVTQSMRLKLLTNEMNKIIPDTFGLIDEVSSADSKEVTT
jgi:hypothetical protein